MHVGLIGGIGPAATEFYYRGLIDRHAAAGTCPDLTIAHADVRDMVRNLAARDPAAQAQIFARLVQRLKSAGAEAAVVTSMDRSARIEVDRHHGHPHGDGERPLWPALLHPHRPAGG